MTDSIHHLLMAFVVGLAIGIFCFAFWGFGYVYSIKMLDGSHIFAKQLWNNEMVQVK